MLNPNKDDSGNIKLPGVSDIIATLVNLLNVLQPNLADGFNKAYQAQLDQLKTDVNDMNKFGDQLMSEGAKETQLVEATVNNDGTISVYTPSSLSTAMAITNMFKNYITGWTEGIGNGLDAVFTGNQKIVAPNANDPLHDLDGKSPQDELNAALDKYKASQTGVVGGILSKFIVPAAQSIIEAILNGLSMANTQLVQPAIEKVTQFVTNGLGKTIGDVFVDGAIGGMQQTVAVPIKFTDPTFDSQANGQNANAGQFVGETFDTASKLFNKSVTGSTTIAYQNVDKSQLKELIAKGTPQGSGW